MTWDVGATRCCGFSSLRVSKFPSPRHKSWPHCLCSHGGVSRKTRRRRPFHFGVAFALESCTSGLETCNSPVQLELTRELHFLTGFQLHFQNGRTNREMRLCAEETWASFGLVRTPHHPVWTRYAWVCVARGASWCWCWCWCWCRCPCPCPCPCVHVSVSVCSQRLKSAPTTGPGGDLPAAQGLPALHRARTKPGLTSPPLPPPPFQTAAACPPNDPRLTSSHDAARADNRPVSLQQWVPGHKGKIP